MQFMLENEQATLQFAASLAQLIEKKLVIYLHGDLGAGKTCFCRGLLRAWGVEGRVKSPTFTLVEPYDIESKGMVYHFDFYRLNDPEETLYLGLGDYENTAFACLIEWPEKANAFLPSADIEIFLKYCDHGREIKLKGNTINGNKVLEQLNEVI